MRIVGFRQKANAVGWIIGDRTHVRQFTQILWTPRPTPDGSACRILQRDRLEQQEAWLVRHVESHARQRVDPRPAKDVVFNATPLFDVCKQRLLLPEVALLGTPIKLHREGSTA